MTTLLVTVGSTCFPALTDFITTPTTLSHLSSLSITTLHLQHGSHPPPPPPPPPPTTAPTVNSFAYTSDLTPLISQSDLIISHAGSGTILEALHLRKSLIVVVNDTLMDNHQTELADAMHQANSCFVVYNNSLSDTLIPTIRRALAAHTPHAPPLRNPTVLTSVVSQELSP